MLQARLTGYRDRRRLKLGTVVPGKRACDIGWYRRGAGSDRCTFDRGRQNFGISAAAEVEAACDSV